MLQRRLPKRQGGRKFCEIEGAGDRVSSVARFVNESNENNQDSGRPLANQQADRSLGTRPTLARPDHD